MPKRKRLFTPIKYRMKIKHELKSGQEVNTARDRLMGALMEVLDPVSSEDTNETFDSSPPKQDKPISEEYLTDEEAKKCLRRSTMKQSYVLKLFDRSVDLSQFRENAPLYPICRAWITNQPKANYKSLESEKEVDTDPDSVELPGPTGGHVSKVPELLPEQQKASRDNINLNYREAPPPTKENLMRSHLERWTAVRQSWLDQAARVEARYEDTQMILNRLNIEYTNSR